MTPPPPTLRLGVEVGYVRSCPECRTIAERTAIAAIHDPSVTSFRAVPGAKHAHAIEGPNPLAEDKPSPEGRLFEHIPQSDTNGFDPPERDK